MTLLGDSELSNFINLERPLRIKSPAVMSLTARRPSPRPDISVIFTFADIIAWNQQNMKYSKLVVLHHTKSHDQRITFVAAHTRQFTYVQNLTYLGRRLVFAKTDDTRQNCLSFQQEDWDCLYVTSQFFQSNCFWTK